jgi:hypothetical protein
MRNVQQVVRNLVIGAAIAIGLANAVQVAHAGSCNVTTWCGAYCWCDNTEPAECNAYGDGSCTFNCGGVGSGGAGCF